MAIDATVEHLYPDGETLDTLNAWMQRIHDEERHHSTQAAEHFADVRSQRVQFLSDIARERGYEVTDEGGFDSYSSTYDPERLGSVLLLRHFSGEERTGEDLKVEWGANEITIEPHGKYSPIQDSDGNPLQSVIQTQPLDGMKAEIGEALDRYRQTYAAIADELRTNPKLEIRGVRSVAGYTLNQWGL